MEILHLKYFASVAECGSFSAAATAHRVAQPKISRYIRNLEDEVGAPLFFRNGRGAELTEVGQYLLTHGNEILERTAAIKAGIQTITKCPSGTVTLGLPPTISSIITLNLIDWIADSYPKVQLLIREASSDHLLELLANGQIDIAVLCDAPNNSTLVSQPVASERMYLVGRKNLLSLSGNIELVDELRDQHVLVPGSPRAIQALIDHPVLAGSRLIPLDCLAAGVDFIRQGRGYAVLPFSYMERMVEARFAGEIQSHDLSVSRVLSVATTTQKPFTPVGRIVANEVARSVKAIATGHIVEQIRDNPLLLSA